jgi:iron(III) transport system permease protein
MRGGILSALTLIWVETIKELPATLLLRPLGLKTLAIEVWERTSESLWAEAALPALAIVAVGLVPLVVGSRLDAGAPRRATPPPGRGRAPGAVEGHVGARHDDG